MWRVNRIGKEQVWYSEEEMQKYMHALTNINNYIKQYLPEKSDLRRAIWQEIKSTGMEV